MITVSLYYSHSTLLTPHSSLHTPHSSLLTPHSSLHTPHSTLLTPHSSKIPHSSLHKVQGKLRIPQKIVGLAVIGGDAVGFDGGAVLLRGIALVALPVVLRVFLG